MIAAEVPILSIEAALAALASFTLVGPLGLPWWLPLVCLTAAAGVIVALGRLSGSRRHDCWKGLAVLRSLHGRNRVVLLVLVAVFAQILRNWLMLHAVGVHASLFDATAVLIAMVMLSQLPIGPSVGAAAVVLILGAGGLAATAAAGVLLTATGITGALCFAAWALLDRLRPGQSTTAIASTSIRYPGSASVSTPTSVSAGLWAPNTAVRATEMSARNSGRW